MTFPVQIGGIREDRATYSRSKKLSVKELALLAGAGGVVSFALHNPLGFTGGCFIVGSVLYFKVDNRALIDNPSCSKVSNLVQDLIRKIIIIQMGRYMFHASVSDIAELTLMMALGAKMAQIQKR